MRRTSALIVGGGPAGSAAAIRLARGGVSPLLIERSRAPHDVVCGGFLGGDALRRLAMLGIDVAALGARAIDRLRIVARSRQIETVLPFRAVGLSRRTLDDALLAAAIAAGAVVERGVAVRRIADGHAEIGDDRIAADAIFLATGKHELRGVARPRAAAGAVGLRRTLAPSPALADLNGVIELHLFDGGYAGLLLQEDGSANLALSVERDRFAAAGGRPEALLDALLPEAPRLGDRIADARAWSAIAGVPYGWRADGTETGLFRIGDQAAVIASIAGDGVAIALASGAAAADAYLRGGGDAAIAFQRRFSRDAAGPLGIAGAARRAAESDVLRPMLWPLLRVPGVAALVGRATRID